MKKNQFELNIFYSLFFLCFFLGIVLIWILFLEYFILLEWTITIRKLLLFKFIVFGDIIRVLFLFIIICISSLVLMFSKEYIKIDFIYSRFFYILFLFVVSIFFLILSPNLFSLLLGWDGLGLRSFLLVCYYQNIKALDAGFVTILTNRLGDVAILLGIGLISCVGLLNFRDDSSKLGFISFILLLAGFTKSAQFPFSAWLPAAIAAPTPVSALVHSSTLVTAGVYLLIRFFNLVNREEWLKIICIVRLYTMLLSGYSANFEFDLKKIIALSTLSQLGFIMFIISNRIVYAAYYYLLIHAFFKSIMFICAGYLIHLSNGIQDIRLINSNIIRPLIIIFFRISNLSLIAFPFRAGYYFKHLAVGYLFRLHLDFFIFFMFLLRILFTVRYSLRISYFIFIKINNKIIEKIFEGWDFILWSIFYHRLLVLFGRNFLIWLLKVNREEQFIFYINSYLNYSFILSLFLIFLILIKKWRGSFIYFFWLKIWFLAKIRSFKINKLIIAISENCIVEEVSWRNLIKEKGLNIISSWISYYILIFQSIKINLLIIRFFIIRVSIKYFYR